VQLPTETGWYTVRRRYLLIAEKSEAAISLARRCEASAFAERWCMSVRLTIGEASVHSGLSVGRAVCRTLVQLFIYKSLADITWVSSAISALTRIPVHRWHYLTESVAAVRSTLTGGLRAPADYVTCWRIRILLTAHRYLFVLTKLLKWLTRIRDDRDGLSGHWLRFVAVEYCFSV